MEERAYSAVGETTPERLRVPPQSIEAEQSVLGGLMLDNRCLDQIGDKLDPEDFYRKEHQLIFKAISNLSVEAKPADVLTVSEYLQNTGDLAQAGGLAYIGTLAKNTPSTANVNAYAEIVRERSVMRRLLSVAGDIGRAVYEPEGRTTVELLDFAERNIFAISEMGSRSGGFQPLTKLLSAAVERIDKLYQSDSPISGLPTGFTDLDGMTSGLQEADLIIVAGRPSMGKTSLAMNIAENVAVGQKLPVAIFSMEMPGEQLAMRMLASMSRINTHKIRTGKLNDDDWPRVTSTISLLAQAPIFIDDTPGLTPMELRARARRLKREHGLALVLVDYLQMMQSFDGSENRATEVSNITRALKNLAKELNVPLIVMSQLNRSLEQRPNKRPVMSDLRESGSIEQDADVILFIYRDEVYNEDSVDKGTAEIMISKHRNGPTGTVRLTFLGQYTKFENYISAGFDETFA
jgi:replicative DNA helicase